MKITAHKSLVRTIRQDDPDFRIFDGFAVVPRAGFHILPECPQSYKQVISECIGNGWLKPVAYVKDSELMWDTLQS